MTRPVDFTALQAVVILVAAVLPFVVAVASPFVWTDKTLVSDNTFLVNLTGLQRLWGGMIPNLGEYPMPAFMPLTYTSYFLESLPGRGSTTHFHLFGLLLHAATAVMVWRLLGGIGVPMAWAVALLFAAYPTQVTPAVWISARGSVLGGLLAVCSLYVLLRWAEVLRPARPTTKPTPDSGDDQDESRPALPDDPRRLLLLGIVLCTLTTLASPQYALLPLVAMAVVWWKGRLTAARRTELVAASVVPFLVLMLAVAVEQSRGTSTLHLGQTPLAQIGARLQLAGAVVGTFFLAPFDPLASGLNHGRWPIEVGNALHYLPIAAVIGGLIVLWRQRDRFGKAPFAVSTCVVLLMLPVSGLVDSAATRDSYISAQFWYLPLAVVIAAAIGGVHTLLGAKNKANVWAIVIGLLAVASAGASYVGAERFTRYGDLTKLAMHNRANVGLNLWVAEQHMDRREFDLAKAAIDTAASRLGDQDRYVRFARARLQERSNPTDVAVLNRVRLEYFDLMNTYRDFAEPFVAVGDLMSAYARRVDSIDNESRATEAYIRAAQLHPWSAAIRVRVGHMFAALTRRQRPTPDTPSRNPDMELIYDQAIALEPNDPQIYVAISTSLVTLHDYLGAIENLAQAQSLDPQNPLIQTLAGDTLVARHDWLVRRGDAESLAQAAADLPAARQQYDSVLTRQPDHVPAIVGLVKIAVRQQNRASAVDILRQALPLTNDHPDLVRVLAELTAPTTAPSIQP